jgi:DNA-binding winged helix-turn-helix (wHTH) protein
VTDAPVLAGGVWRYNVNIRATDLVERPSGQPVRDEPVIDAYGLLRWGSAWVALSPIEARLAQEFIARPGQLVGRETLGDAGWPDGVPNARSVDSRIKTLRRRVEPLGLKIHTIRGRGYLASFDRDED